MNVYEVVGLVDILLVIFCLCAWLTVILVGIWRWFKSHWEHSMKSAMEFDERRRR